jgi:hypothetical protein
MDSAASSAADPIDDAARSAHHGRGHLYLSGSMIDLMYPARVGWRGLFYESTR